MTTPAPPVYNARYELREQIGRGGTAQVFLARDLLLDRPVALKVLMSELSRDPSFVERFRREAQAAANLTHPNIVSVFDWGESDETYFIVMEYIDGESLASIVRTQAPLAPVQASSIGADIANALSYAHRHGVIHRDVKPGNVLITADGQVKVTDFGIARAVGSDDQITQTGLVMGTATYFSPEQAQGLGVDGRSDVYALGVVLYEMVVGRPPFHGDNPVSIAYQHVREQAPTPRSLNPSVPLALEAIILQAIAKLPTDRYASADELRADLGRFVHDQPVLARPPGGTIGEMTEAVTATPPVDATVAVPSVETTGIPDVDGGERPRRTTGRWAFAGLALLVGILFIIFFVGRDLGYFGGGTFVKVPYVLKEQRAKARADLVRKHFKVTEIPHPATASSTANEVFDEVPNANTSARQGSVVKISYYLAPRTVLLPDVRQLSESAAVAKLKAAKFKVSTKTVEATSPDEQQHIVVDESPSPGGKVERGFTITITVIQGTSLVRVPTVVGDSTLQASNVIGKANLVVGTVTVGGFSSVTAGDVSSTDPAVGTQVAPNTVVNMKTSRGPGVVIPNVVNQTLATAEEELSQAGLTSEPSQGCDLDADPSQYGYVVQQSPQYVAGRMVAPSHPVHLTTGCAPSTSTTPASTPPGSTVPMLYVLPPATASGRDEDDVAGPGA